MVGISGKIKSDGLKTKMIMQVHDELVFEVPEPEMTVVSKMVREIMQDCFPISVPIIVDLKVGPNWADMKSLDV